ncbi:GPW/gp25 family protein, partial [Enterobacteriaceae bacterium LUAb1]
FADLFLLFSSRPILPEENRYPELRSSVLNYGVKIIDNARMGGDKGTIEKSTADNILLAINTYEKRLSDVTVEKYSVTAEKMSFKVMGIFNNSPISFIVAWEISVASYSLDRIR